MKSHLDIEIEARAGEGFKPLVLPDDFSISVEEPNPVFNDTSFFSYPCKVSTAQNMAVLKNIAHRDSAMRGMDLEHARARVVADGLPLNSGQVITSEDAEIGPTFDFNIDAQTESFSDLIGDLECQDVKVKDKIVIGEKIGKMELTYAVVLSDKNEIEYYMGSGPYNPVRGSKTYNATGHAYLESPMALGFSVPGRTRGFPAAEQKDGKPVITESFINVSQPYPFPYCNARVAYAHPDVKKNDDGTEETDGIVKGNAKGTEPEDYGQYWCLDANRQQSGPCFYVLYFLDCLFQQLGVAFDKTDLLQIEDITRLAFFTTQCHFDEEVKSQRLTSWEELNTWLSTRGCKTTMKVKMVTGKVKNKHQNGADYTDPYWPNFACYDGYESSELPEEYEFPIENSRERFLSCLHINSEKASIGYDTYPTHADLYYREITAQTILTSAEVCDMIANSDNFPEVSVKSVIEALENSFGVRFLYDSETRTVKARLLRNIYKEAGVKQFNGRVLSMTPMNEKITGVRMQFSEESERKEQQANVRRGVKDYDTDYDYIEYPEDRTIVNLTYQEITKKVSNTNKNVYVDLTTGNRYRIKIDSEAQDLASMRPILFQVGQNKGIELGDCSEKNENYVREFVSEITPLKMNIINAMDYNNDTTGEVSPVLAPLLDVEMEHEYLPFRIQNVVTHIDTPPTDEMIEKGIMAFPNGVDLVLVQEFSLAESYDPTQTDDGNSPLQELDWGLTMAVMRGGGEGAEIVNYDQNYDGFGNYRWRDTVAVYTLSSDTMDPKGVTFDYNGVDPGLGIGERFSLQICAYAQFVYYIDTAGKIHISYDMSLLGQPVEGVSGKVWLLPCNDDERDQQGNIVTKIRSRGLYDSFMTEHFYFLLNRKKYKVKALATIAQLLDIRNHWGSRYNLDGKIGFIDRLKYNITRVEGVREVEMDFYAI